jgi:hypothetical protein
MVAPISVVTETILGTADPEATFTKAENSETPSLSPLRRLRYHPRFQFFPRT